MNKIRRNLFKQLAFTGTTAGVLLPTHWKTPIVTSIVLPAHAQLSFFNCGTSVSTTSEQVNNNGENDSDIFVAYDCETQECQIALGVFPDSVGVPSDAILAIDVDGESDEDDDGATFDVLESGSNWSFQGGDISPGTDDVAPGSFLMEFDSNVADCARVRITFDVDVVSLGNFRYRMTLSNLMIMNLV